ncbi:unnamed protein product [Parajaminaea phylloscopi]
MTLVDVAAALLDGATPTNHQALLVLARLRTACHRRQSAGPRSAGRTRPTLDRHVFWSDLDSLLAATEDVLTQVNSDEQVQQLLWGLHSAGAQAKKAQTNDETTGDAEKAGPARRKRDRLRDAGSYAHNLGTSGWHHLVTLARTALIQPELRQILADFALLALEVVDQTASDAFGPDARQQVGQVVSTLADGAASDASQVGAGLRTALSDADLDNIGVEALQAAARFVQRQGSLALGSPSVAERSEGTPAHLSELHSRLQASIELAQRKRRGQRIELNTTSVQELRDLLADPTGPPLPQSQPLASSQPLPPVETGSGPDHVSAGTHPLKGTSRVPLSGKDVADLIQLIGVDSALAKTLGRCPSALSEIKMKATDASHRARAEGAKNTRIAWQEKGRERLMARLRNLLVDVQAQESSRQALLWFLDETQRLLRWAARIRSVYGSVSARMTPVERSIEAAISLVENLAGGSEVRPVLKLLGRLLIGYQDEPVLRELVDRVDQYLRDCLLKDGWVLEEECRQEGRSIAEAVVSLSDSYKSDIKELLVRGRNLLQSAPQTPSLRRLLRSCKKLGRDLTMGPHYWYMPKPHVWQQVFRELLPPLFARAGVIPVPRIKYTHPEFVLTLEDIGLSLSDLLPNTVDFRVTNDFHIDVRHIRESSHLHSFKLKIKGMGLRLHKIAFAVELLKGIKWHDKGILDLVIRDVGLTIYLDVPKEYSQHFFTVRKVKGKLGKLQVAVRKSNHAILHRLAEAFVDSRLTKLILRNLMAKGVTIGLKQLDIALMQMRLNPRKADDRKHIVRLREQAAELRDLMVKLREQAGSLEIDLLERRSDGTAGDSALTQWEQQTHALRWIKSIFQKTGAKEVVRDEWRSNVFDLGEDSVFAKPVPADRTVEGQSQTSSTQNSATCTPEHQSVLDGSTPKPGHGSQSQEREDAIIEDAEGQLQAQKRRHAAWFFGRRKKALGRSAMESDAGRTVADSKRDTKDQVKALEQAVDARDGDV